MGNTKKKVMVSHEGLVGHIKTLVENMDQEGLICLARDLYGCNFTPADTENPEACVYELDVLWSEGGHTEPLEDAISALREAGAVVPNKRAKGPRP